MRITTALIIIFSLQLFAIPTQAGTALTGDTIAREGNGDGAPPCMSCHGDKGQGVPAAGYPYLAGQSEVYLAKQLTDFSSKRRSSSVMLPIASSLSAQEINTVAAYYSRLALPAASAKQANNSQNVVGKALANAGKWSAGMPACIKCHGENGAGVPPNFPAVAGQSSAYLQLQLKLWQDGKRTNDPAGLMQAVVEHLNDAEISAVSDYLSSESPVKSK